MPNLGDYLGQLLSEISIARMQADLETVRLAELYAAHPLLRTMPVPHVRLPDVQLDIPVLIQNAEEPRAGESPRGGVPLAEMRKKFDDVLNKLIPQVGAAVSAAARRALGKALDDHVAAYGTLPETAVDVNRLADELSAIAWRTISEAKPAGGVVPKDLPASAAEELKQTVRLEFLRLRTPPPRLSVLVTTAEIRDAGPSANITRLHLTVSESGMEWTTIESEGIQRDRLVPE